MSVGLAALAGVAVVYGSVMALLTGAISALLDDVGLREVRHD